MKVIVSTSQKVFYLNLALKITCNINVNVAKKWMWLMLLQNHTTKTFKQELQDFIYYFF